jgi:prepilin-type N-terminal cleavage/methylation domain-containing protein
MILPTGNKRSSDRWCDPACAGFTLIELVLVMAILIVVLSMSGASLTSFFKGRTLEAEGKRFLALTRYAQNRAISEGLPMVLWMDEKERKFGLVTASGFVDTDGKSTEFTLGRDLEIEVTWPSTTAMQNAGNTLQMRFQPDGFLPETNPELIIIKEPKNEQAGALKGASVMIAPSRNRLYYEISTNELYTARR